MPVNDFLSVIICTFNRADSLRIAAETVLAQATDGSFTYELVIVDDSSTDHTRATVEALAAAAPNVRYVCDPSSKGIAHARNVGVTNTEGGWIVFFDDDQLADPGWLIALMEVARAHNAKIVGGARRLDLDDAALNRLGPVCRSLLGENLYEEPPIVMQGKELPTTGNLLVSREVFDAIGHFDVNLTISSGEDADLIRRARANGTEVWTAPRAVVAHMIPAYRTTEAYFRWVSRRWGTQFAQIDMKQLGAVAIFLLAIARAAQALALRVPKMLLAKARGDKAAEIDAHALIWRAEGYLRRTLYIISPRFSGQHRFINDLEFRNERQLFGGS